ncbi:hypothetical protein [uncultured Flavobacterium sp.]|uniref:hypothetical protein n=1 Tax=uncultured Flavobacterium sp. TaxID=165435 RepID=UPI0025FDF72A|nr:hypothetical protein [uncultured Flavobacterium sp.]
MKNTYLENNDRINFGTLLQAYFKKNRIYKSALARKINRSDSVIAAYQKRPSMQSAIIAELSHAMKHNFFADLADLLPESYSKDETKWIEKDARIASLEREIEILKAEKEVLLVVLRK